MAPAHWQADQRTLAGLLFTGAPDLLRQLDSLIRRPWRYGREKLLPILYLVAPGEPSALDGIEDRLGETRGRKVAYARIGQASTDTGEPAIRQLLDAAVTGLASKVQQTSRLRFPHYSLATWLIQLKITADHADRLDDRIAEDFKRFVRDRHPLANADYDQLAGLQQLPLTLLLMVSLTPRLLLKLVMRLALNVWGVPRWFSRHRLARSHRRQFILLARAFAQRKPDVVEPDTVQRLLVEAFLQDLRRAYRRSRIFGLGRQRTTYPVLLVDGNDRAAASQLLALFTKSRNAITPSRRRERYTWDPLLVVATGSLDGLPEASGPPGEILPVAEIGYAYPAWEAEVHAAGRDRSWLLPLAVPSGPAPVRGRTDLVEAGIPRGRRPVAGMLAIALVAATLAAAYTDLEYRRCGAPWWESTFLSKPLGAHDTQCVGLAPLDYRFSDELKALSNGNDKPSKEIIADFEDVENKISEANSAAMKKSGHLTVAFLSSMTPGTPDGYQSIVNQLRGIAVAQHQYRDYAPVVVRLANAGQDMMYAKLAAMAITEDDTIKAVIGPTQSRKETKEAIELLDQNEVPMVGTAISATPLASVASHYFQVGPTNKREALVAAHHAVTQRITKATIVYSDNDDDLYSKDLHEQTATAFDGMGIDVEEIPYHHDPQNVRPGTAEPPNSVAKKICVEHPDRMVFYAGRNDAISPFLNGMKDSCGSTYPVLLAGDDVTRFVINDSLAGFPNIRLKYFSFASRLAWGSKCDSQDFPIQYSALFTDSNAFKACSDSQLDGSMLTYDAARTLFTQAVAEVPVTKSGLLIGLQNTSGLNSLLGATGRISFSRTGGEPANKAILLLEATHGKPTTRVLLCGEHPTAVPAPDITGCPPA